MRSSATARSGTRIARHCARADSQVWCAVSPQLDGYGGVYCEDVDIAAVHTSDVPDTEVLAVTPGAFGVLPCAVDRDSAARLWALSEELLDRR
jgi:hypothetical protein